MASMNSGMNAGDTLNTEDQTQERFSLVFDESQVAVLEVELATWQSACVDGGVRGVAIRTEHNHKDSSITVHIEGGADAVLAKAQELMELQDSVKEVTLSLPEPNMYPILHRHIPTITAHLSHAGHEVKIKPGAGGSSTTVLCLDAKAAAVVSCIRDQFARRRLPLTSQQEAFLPLSPEWADRKRELEEDGKLAIVKGHRELVLTGLSVAVSEASDVVSQFLKGKSHSIEKVEVTDGNTYRLVEKHYRPELDAIKKKFKDGIHITLEKEDSKFYIKVKGGSQDVKDAKIQVENLLSGIRKEEVPCHKPGMACYLTDPGADGPALLKDFEDKHHCVVQVNSLTKPAAENVKVIKGDLTQQKVDVIVIPVVDCGSELEESGMVAQAVGRVGGAAMKADFSQHHGGLAMGRVSVSREKGKLPCKAVMYFGIGSWRGYSTRKLLAAGVEYVMQKVKELGYGSVAFPTIGCGQAKFPAHEVGQVIATAAKAATDIKVSIVVYDDQLYANFSTAVRTQRPNKGNSGSTGVSVGDITKTRADVLVCPVTTDCQDVYKDCGEVARAIATAAGRPFSREYSAAGGLGDGEVRAQDPHGLASSCSKVIHVSIRKWKKNTEKVLESCLHQVLRHMERAGFSTVAFPTLGCGKLGYRPHVIAALMRKVIRQYPALQVEIVAFKNDDIYDRFVEAFEEEGAMVAEDAQSLSLEVYAKNPQALTTAETDLNKFIDKHYREEKPIKYSPHGDQDAFHRRLTKEMAHIQNQLAFIQIDPSRQQIYIQGEKAAVGEAKSKVDEALHKMKPEKKPHKASKKAPQCDYAKLCEEYFKVLKLPEVFFNHEYDRCYCKPCHDKRGESDYFNRGKPLKKYSTPVGWYKFALHMSARASANNVDNEWHRCYHGTKPESIEKILRVGQLVSAGTHVMGGGKVDVLPGHITPGAVPGFDVHQVFVSPSMLYSDMYAHRQTFKDGSGKQHFGKVAFQVLIEPSSYKVGKETVRAPKAIDPQISNNELEWSTNQTGSTELYAFLVKVEQVMK